MSQIVIANSLADGFVVFLTATHEWSGNIAEAAVAETAETAAELLETAVAAERNNRVIDPYLIPATIENGVPKPLDYREYIRAFGPSVSIPT